MFTKKERYNNENIFIVVLLTENKAKLNKIKINIFFSLINKIFAL